MSSIKTCGCTFDRFGISRQCAAHKRERQQSQTDDRQQVVLNSRPAFKDVRLIAESIDGLLSNHLSPSVYLEQCPSIQEMIAAIENHVTGSAYRQEHLENESAYRYGSADTEGEQEESMSSEIAGKIAVASTSEVFPTRISVARYVDEQLQEIRSVLETLAPRTNVEQGSNHCWCSKNLIDPGSPHSKDCERARALWERLSVPAIQAAASDKEGGGDGR